MNLLFFNQNISKVYNQSDLMVYFGDFKETSWIATNKNISVIDNLASKDVQERNRKYRKEFPDKPLLRRDC